jgi:hypothetical protein
VAATRAAGVVTAVRFCPNHHTVADILSEPHRYHVLPPGSNWMGVISRTARMGRTMNDARCTINDEFFEPGDGVHVEFAVGSPATFQWSRAEAITRTTRDAPPFLEASILSCCTGQQDDGVTVIEL